jgi:hypothetical protein
MGAGIASSPGTGAFEPPPFEAALAQDVEGQILEILDEYDAAMGAFLEATREAESDEARSQLQQDAYPDTGEYAKRLWAVVDAQPEHPACAEALAWIFLHAGDPDGRAEQLLLEHHIGSEHIGVLCTDYMRRPAGAQATLRRIVAEAGTPEVAGLAKMCLGEHLMALADRAEEVQALTEEERWPLGEQNGDEALIEWMDSDPELLREEGVELLEDVVANYADVPHPYGGTIGASADGFLFALRNLQVGMIAPDIVGEDLSGVEFKLSDYRGKVVVLDFWGNW